MLKYLAALFLIFGLAVYISIQDKRAAEQSTQNATGPNNGALPANAEEYHPQENVSDAERNLPSWYGFFRWPNGTTVWAIVLTLVVIADQTSQTAKAAKIAHATFVTQYRPKVIVSNIALNPATSTEYDRLDDGIWKVELLLFNNGDTTAHVKHCEVGLSLWGDHPIIERERYQSKKWPHFCLAPRERKPLEMQIEGEGGELRIAIHVLENTVRDGRQQVSTIMCAGIIKYADDNGAIRQTEFRRGWDIRNKRFITYDNPEHEYQD